VLTFVINLHTEIPNLGLGAPFLYEAEHNKQLKCIFSKAPRIERLNYAVEEVARTLDGSAFVDWQVVFVLNVFSTAENGYLSSISAQLELIKKLFLNKLENYVNPKNAFIVLADSFNDRIDFPSFDKSANYKTCWKLDAMGDIRWKLYTKEERAMLKSIDEQWKNKIDLNKNEITNAGFDGLSPTFQIKVQQAIDDIKVNIDTVLAADSINYNDFAIKQSQNINLIDETIVNKIKNQFYTELENVKQEPLRYGNFVPSESLQDNFNDYLGMFSFENQKTFTYTRLPFKADHADQFQQNLIRLSLLINMLCKDPHLLSNTQSKALFSTIEWDDEIIKKMYLKQFEVLSNQLKRLQGAAKQPDSIEFEQVFNHDCDYPIEAADKKFEKINFSYIKKNESLNRWIDWSKQMGETIDNVKEECNDKVQKSIESNHKKTIRKERSKVEDAHDTQKSINKELAKQQQLVDTFEISNIDQINWDETHAEQEQKIKPLLFRRPNKNVVAISIAIGFILFLLPIFVTKQKPTFYLIALFLAVGSAALAWFLARKKIVSELQLSVNETFDKGRDIKSEIFKNFEQQKSFLSELCKLNISRINADSANQSLSVLTLKKLLLDYHIRKIEQHKGDIQKALRIFKTNDSLLPQAMPASLNELVLEQTVASNNMYNPVTYLSALDRLNNIEANVENRKKKMSGRYAQALSLVEFVNDKIYTTN